jgi:hypothetical protein
MGVPRWLEGRRFSGRLGWQFELEFVEEELEFGLRLGVAGELDLAPVGGRNLDVDQLQGGELLQDASWAEARGERGQPSCQRHRDRRQDLMAPSNPSSTTSSIGSPRPTAPRTRPRSAIPTSAGRATTIRRSHPGPPRPQCAPHRANRREPAPRPRQTAQNGLTQNHVR